MFTIETQVQNSKQKPHKLDHVPACYLDLANAGEAKINCLNFYLKYLLRPVKSFSAVQAFLSIH